MITRDHLHTVAITEALGLVLPGPTAQTNQSQPTCTYKHLPSCIQYPIDDHMTTE